MSSTHGVRRWVAGFAVAGISAGLALTSLPTASARPAQADAGGSSDDCRVTNLNEKTKLKSQDGSALTTAIELAAPGDRLLLKGVCDGSFTVMKDLVITGGNAEQRPEMGFLVVLDPVTGEGNTDVKLHNLEINGGAHFQDFTTARLWKVRVRGRIVLYSYDVKAFDSTIEDSTGWGIFVIGKITLVRSVVRNNGSVLNGPGGGGGIIIETGRVKLRQSTVIDNIGTDINLNDSRVTVICSQIGHGPPTNC